MTTDQFFRWLLFPLLILPPLLCASVLRDRAAARRRGGGPNLPGAGGPDAGDASALRHGHQDRGAHLRAGRLAR